MIINQIVRLRQSDRRLVYSYHNICSNVLQQIPCPNVCTQIPELTSKSWEFFWNKITRHEIIDVSPESVLEFRKRHWLRPDLFCPLLESGAEIFSRMHYFHFSLPTRPRRLFTTNWSWSQTRGAKRRVPNSWSTRLNSSVCYTVSNPTAIVFNRNSNKISRDPIRVYPIYYYFKLQTIVFLDF